MTIQKINSNDTVKQVSIEQGKNNTYNKPLDMTQATDSSNITPPTLSNSDLTLSRIPQEDVDKINKLGRLPDNAWISYSNGQYHIGLKSSLTKFFGQGTSIIPNGYELKNDDLGFTNVVPKGWESPIMKNYDTYPDSDVELSTTELLTNRIPQDKVNKLNKERILPENARFAPGTYTETETETSTDSEGNTETETTTSTELSGKFVLVPKVKYLGEGTRRFPEGQELKNDVLGFTNVVPEGWQGLGFEDSNINLPESTVKLSKFEAWLGRISQDKVDKINTEGVLPDNLLITMYNGDSKQYSLVTNTALSTGTRKIPKGFELKNNNWGFTNIYPKGQEGSLLKSK